MSLVLDASMTIAWLFEDERTPAAHDVMRRVVREGPLVPMLWRLEVANVLRNAVRRQHCDEAYANRSLARLARLAIKKDEETEDHARHSGASAIAPPHCHAREGEDHDKRRQEVRRGRWWRLKYASTSAAGGKVG